MSRARVRASAGIAVGTIAGVLAMGTATAAPKAPAKKKIAIVGHFVFKAGKSAFDDQHVTPRKFDIRSGGTVTLRNKARTEDPHTRAARGPRTDDLQAPHRRARPGSGAAAP